MSPSNPTGEIIRINLHRPSAPNTSLLLLQPRRHRSTREDFASPPPPRMFCRRAAASSLEILPAWIAAAGAADSALPPELVLLPHVDCRRIPDAGAAASSPPPEPPRPVPTSAPSAMAGADFPPPPAPTSSSSAAVPIPSPIPSIPIISCRSPPTLPHNPILYQKSKTTSIGMETSCFRLLNCLPIPLRFSV
uniref:Uncharacterized protein n=1 Tax=Oryza rufipogon TaxID=4529 RepID=A0A0E0QGF6_ORYRU